MNETGHRDSVNPYWRISVLCWPIAILGYAASAGLFTGVIQLGDDADARLIAGSPILAGFVVLLAIAAPMTVAAHQAGARRRTSARTAFTAGVLLVACMAVQIVLVRDFSIVQVILVAAGLAVAVVGYRAMAWPTGSEKVGPARIRPAEGL